MKKPTIDVSKLKTGIIRSIHDNKITKAYLQEAGKLLVGEIVHVHLTVASTKFEVEDYIKKSKKLRSDISDRVKRDPLEYQFVGLCLKARLDENLTDSRVLLRNVFSGCAYEYYCPIYSPNVANFSIDSIRSKIQMRRRGFYGYFRRKTLPENTVIFTFVGLVSYKYKDRIHEAKSQGNR